MNHDEITPDTRLLLIELAEGFAEGVRNGTIRFSESNAKALVGWAEGILHPEHNNSGDIWKNATEICDYIGFTAQTFRNYVRKGMIPKGEKRRGYAEPMWRKTDIDTFAGWSRAKKVLREAVVNSQAKLWKQDADNLHGQERIDRERAIAIVQSLQCASIVCS